MARPIVIVCAFAAVVATAACNVYACKYETRFISLRGTSTSGIGTITVEYVSFRQYGPDQPVSNSVGYVARGEGLTSAPASLELRDTRNGGRLVATLGMNSSPTSFAAASAFEVAADGREAMFQFLSSGSAQVVLRLANGNSVIVPLTIASQEDWHRPSCD